MRFVPEADRRLVVLVLVCLAKGDKKVPWLKLKRRLGVPFGADGLRMRYSRAITQVAKTLNSAENREAALGSCLLESGCSLLASLRKAFFISAALAPFDTPRTS